jgi:hypothetical protein
MGEKKAPWITGIEGAGSCEISYVFADFSIPMPGIRAGKQNTSFDKAYKHRCLDVVILKLSLAVMKPLMQTKTLDH